MSAFPAAPAPFRCVQCLVDALTPADLDAAVRGVPCLLCEEDSSEHEHSGVWDMKSVPPPPKESP